MPGVALFVQLAVFACCTNAVVRGVGCGACDDAVVVAGVGLLLPAVTLLLQEVSVAECDGVVCG